MREEEHISIGFLVLEMYALVYAKLHECVRDIYHSMFFERTIMAAYSVSVTETLCFIVIQLGQNGTHIAIRSTSCRMCLHEPLAKRAEFGKIPCGFKQRDVLS